jgi:hypothetical protein
MNTTADVEWVEDLPPERNTKYNWLAISRQLQARPGEWAKIFDRDRTAIVNAIRQNNIHAVRPLDGFQVRTRNNVRDPVRMCTLYMRYVPRGGE